MALLRGDIDFINDADISAAQHVKASKLRILGSSGVARVTNYPDVPAFREVVPNNPAMTAWHG